VLDDGNITAGLPKDTKRMFLPEGRSGRFLEYLHFDSSDILAHPLIEDDAEKIAPGFGRHGAAAHATFSI